MWRHEDFWRVLGGGIDFMTGEPLERVRPVEAGRRTRRMVTFPLSPLMHGGAQAGAADAPVRRAPDDPRAEVRPGPHLADHRARERPADLHDRRRDGPAADRGLRAQGGYDGSERCSRSPAAPRSSAAPVKERWMAAFPNTFFTDSVGASETGFQGTGLQDAENIKRRGPRGRARARAASCSTRTTGSSTRPPTSARSAGWPAAAHVPVGYYKDPEKSARDVHRDRRRCATPCPATSPGSRPDNKVTLLGRGSNCVNTGGEKVYPEEVEMAIKAHPAVYDVLVVGVPDEKYGQAVAAVVQPREGATVELDELRDVPADLALRLQAAPRAHPRRRDPAQRDRQGAVPPGQGARPAPAPATMAGA